MAENDNLTTDTQIVQSPSNISAERDEITRYYCDRKTVLPAQEREERRMAADFPIAMSRPRATRSRR